MDIVEKAAEVLWNSHTGNDPDRPWEDNKAALKEWWRTTPRALMAAGWAIFPLPTVAVNERRETPFWKISRNTQVWVERHVGRGTHIVVGDHSDCEMTATLWNLDEAEQTAMTILQAVKMEREREEGETS